MTARLCFYTARISTSSRTRKTLITMFVSCTHTQLCMSPSYKIYDLLRFFFSFTHPVMISIIVSYNGFLFNFHIALQSSNSSCSFIYIYIYIYKCIYIYILRDRYTIISYHIILYWSSSSMGFIY